MVITFLPMNRKLQSEPGTNLMQIARENGIDFGGTCSGNRTCGKCKALITKGNDKKFSQEELRFLSIEEQNAGMRLTCCFTITQDTCVIMSSKQQNENNFKSNIDSMNQYNIKSKYNEVDKQDKVSCKQDKNYLNQNEIIPQNKSINNKINYGIAIDIGTTTVEAELWDIDNKIKMGQQSLSNPQSLYGADVIARVTYATSSNDNLKRLTNLIRTCCNQIIAQLTESLNINKEEVNSVVVAANTTMSHIFLNKSVDNLARVPFRGISYEGEECIALDLGIEINPTGTVYTMPGIGGHVGSDTLGCILAKNLSQTDGMKLLIDIGTNGEIVLANDKKLIACSTAAGPAFEGASLHQGMRAIEGAISKVQIKDGILEIEVIGEKEFSKESTSNIASSFNKKSFNKKSSLGNKTHNVKEPTNLNSIHPIGICGSGVIEAISELYQSKLIDHTGRLLGKAGEDNYFTLWQGIEEKDKVILTQKDIREIQLAKGAIYAGILMLLKEEKVELNEIDTIYLAGAFGTYLNIRKGIHIGLLPPISTEKYECIGNGALNGAVKILLGEVSKEEAEKISKNIKHVELALKEEFEEEFIHAISFPT